MVKAAKDSLAASRSQGPSGRDIEREPFSQHTLIQHLVNFIVADDQVSCAASSLFLSLISSQSINIVECPEFRKLLLLLRPDLGENHIPHRTKLRESIISAWGTWFQTLKSDLSVFLFSVAHLY